MSNPHRGEVEIELGGEIRNLRINHKAVEQIERILGRGIAGIFDETYGVSTIVTFLVVGLKHADSRITRDKILKMMEESGTPLSYYTDRLAIAVGNVLNPGSYDDQLADEGGTKATPIPLTGTGS